MAVRIWCRLLWMLFPAFLAAGLVASREFDTATGTGTCSFALHASPFGSSSTCPAPQHDATAPGSPWSHPPHCVAPANWPIGSPSLCVFTASHFRGGAGLGLLATPELAASIVDRLDDAAVPPRERDHPSSPLLAGRDDPDPDPPFAVEDVPGRGKGVVARRAIRKGETVLVDFPAAIVQNDYHYALSPEQARAALRKLVGQLPEQQREQVLALQGPSGEGDSIEDILKANVFSVDLTQTPFALYPKGSRLNHDCRPNAYWRFSRRSLAQEFIAMRDIGPGEEITHSYTSPGLKHADRKRVLGDWGFTCGCSLCSGAAEEIEASDGRRDRLGAIFAALQNENPDGDAVTKMAGEMAELIDRESMWPMLCPFYQVLSTASMENWDFGEAERYAGLAEDVCGRIGGDDPGSAQRIRRLWTMLEKRRQEGL